MPAVINILKPSVRMALLYEQENVYGCVSVAHTFIIITVMVTLLMDFQLYMYLTLKLL
jgi:hypothetical protein